MLQFKIWVYFGDYANADYDLIIAHDFECGEPAVNVGKDYPVTKYIYLPYLIPMALL
jgi:basic membrane protein A